MKLLSLPLPLLGFIQATGLVGYVVLITTMINTGENWFDGTDSFAGPLFFLLVFIISATISATIVLGRVGYLFWERRYRESFTLLGWTISSAIAYTATILGWLIFR